MAVVFFLSGEIEPCSCDSSSSFKDNVVSSLGFKGLSECTPGTIVALFLQSAY